MLSHTVRFIREGGRRVASEVYNPAGKLTHRQLVTRSRDSTRAEEIYHDGEEVSGRLVWVQNDDGSMREETEYAADGSVKVAASYVDDLPRSTVYGPGGAVKQRTYFTLDAQDSYGNWTKRTQWVVEAGRPARAEGFFYRAVTHY